jgi:hypothetical protein
MCDMVKHERHNLEVPEVMVHIMAPETKQNKFAEYEAPALAVRSLTDMQYAELTQEQHPVNDWNRIILAISAGRFDNELEYEGIKQRASKKSAFSQSCTPMKRVKFTMEGSTAGAQDLDLEASADIQTLLKPRQSVSEGVAHVLMGNDSDETCTYVHMLNDKPPELQEIISISK